MKRTVFVILMFLMALIANNKPLNAQMPDANACQLKTIRVLNDNSSTSIFCDKSLSFCDSIRALSEINVVNLADAYPYLSSDGLRLYYTHQTSSGNNLYVASRNNINAHFSNKVILSSNIPDGSISCWLTNNELEIYFVNNNLLYYASRPSLAGSFSVPTCVSLAGGNTFQFLSGPSLTPDKQELYIYKAYVNGNTCIYKYNKTGTTTYTLNDSICPPAGYTEGPGQLSKDGLKYYFSMKAPGNDSMKIYRLSRPNLSSDFANLSILEDSINSSAFLSNMQPTVSSNNNIIIWVRNLTVNAWVSDDLYIGYGSFSAIQDKPFLNNISIYPNPASEKIYVDCKFSKTSLIEIYDQLGNLIIQKELHSGINEMDIVSLNKGIYIAKVTNKEQHWIQKIIKE